MAQSGSKDLKFGMKERVELAKNLQLYMQIWIIRNKQEENFHKKAFAEFLRASLWGPHPEMATDTTGITLAKSLEFMKPYYAKLGTGRNKPGKNGTYFPDEVVSFIAQTRKMALPLYVRVPSENFQIPETLRIMDLNKIINPSKPFSIFYPPFSGILSGNKQLDLSKFSNLNKVKFFQSGVEEPTPMPKPPEPPKLEIKEEEPALEEELPQEEDILPEEEEAEIEEKVEEPAPEQKDHDHPFFEIKNIGNKLADRISIKNGPFHGILKTERSLNNEQAAKKIKSCLKRMQGLKRSLEKIEIPEDVMDGLVEMFFYLRKHPDEFEPANIKLLLSIAIDELVLVRKDGRPILFNAKPLTFKDMKAGGTRIVKDQIRDEVNACDLIPLKDLDLTKLQKLGYNSIEDFRDFVNEPNIKIKEANGVKRKEVKKEAKEIPVATGEDIIAVEESEPEDNGASAAKAAILEEAITPEEPESPKSDDEAKDIIADDQEEIQPAPEKSGASAAADDDGDSDGEDDDTALNRSVFQDSLPFIAEAEVPDYKLPKELEFASTNHTRTFSKKGIPNIIQTFSAEDVMHAGMDRTYRGGTFDLKPVKVNVQTKIIYCSPKDLTENTACLRAINEGNAKYKLKGNDIPLFEAAMLSGYIIDKKSGDIISASEFSKYGTRLLHDFNKLAPLKALFHYFIENIRAERAMQPFAGEEEDIAQANALELLNRLPEKFASFVKSANEDKYLGGAITLTKNQKILFDFEIMARDLYITSPDAPQNASLYMLAYELFDIPYFKETLGKANYIFEDTAIGMINTLKSWAHTAYSEGSKKKESELLAFEIKQEMSEIDELIELSYYDPLKLFGDDHPNIGEVQAMLGHSDNYDDDVIA